MKLNSAQIKSLVAKGEPLRISDGEGLNLTINKSGTVHWRLSYRFDGKQKTKTLGQYPQLSLAQARLKKQSIKADLQKGIDPIAEVIVKPENISLEDAGKEWFDISSNKWSEKHKKETWKSLNDNVFKFIGNVAIEDITTQDLISILKLIEKRGALIQLSKIRLRVQKIFIYSKVSGYLEKNAAEGIEMVLKSASSKNYNHINLELLPDLVKSINESVLLPTTKAGLQIALHTFLRTNEIRFAKWSEIDFKNKIWTIPPDRMKMSRAHLVPLSKYVINVLNDLRPYTERFDYVFASSHKPETKPISENAMLYALYRLGWHGRMTVHGFRHLASTTLREIGFDRHLVEKQLSHETKNKVEAAYNKAEYLPLRIKMMNEWSSFIESYNGNVIPINFKKDKIK